MIFEERQYIFINAVLSYLDKIQRPILLILTNIILLSATAQQERVITGIVYSMENSKTLPYASVYLKNHFIGTVTNTKGRFEFQFPDTIRNDTLMVSYLGHKDYSIPLKAVKGALKIPMQPVAEEIGEVVVYPLPPTYYIKKAIEKIPENAAEIPASKRLDTEKDIEDQIHNDSGPGWEDINVVGK